jgi:hypothetical protein
LKELGPKTLNRILAQSSHIREGGKEKERKRAPKSELLLFI